MGDALLALGLWSSGSSKLNKEVFVSVDVVVEVIVVSALGVVGMLTVLLFVL